MEPSFTNEIRRRIDGKTKPTGSLGQLEELALQIAELQQSLSPVLRRPTILVFAADHGAAIHPISAYPSEVTGQMVRNFLAGGAAINVFSRQNGLELRIVDCGIKGPPVEHPSLISCRLGNGTSDYTQEDAISQKQWQQCQAHATEIIEGLHSKGCNVVGFGEMGIGNTSSASLLLHRLGPVALEECVGAGSGLAEEKQRQKLEILCRASERKPKELDALSALLAFGGFEIASMVAAMKEAYLRGMLLLIDGFIASSAFLVAYRLDPSIRRAAVFCHQSAEKAHARMLSIWNARPLLSLDLRLGEGTGCALAYPLVRSAVAFLNEMATFESANVSGRDQCRPDPAAGTDLRRPSYSKAEVGAETGIAAGADAESAAGADAPMAAGLEQETVSGTGHVSS